MKLPPHVKSGNSAAAIPRSPPVGELYYDTGRLALMCFDGASWVEIQSRTMPLAPTVQYPYVVICHLFADRVVGGFLDHMPVEPCEVWLFNQGLIQHCDFASYYDYLRDNRGNLSSEYRLTVRFRDEKIAEMFRIVWGGERVKK
jgi:hypothetical protein